MDAAILKSHWGDHWDDFAVANAVRYEHLADRFLSGPKVASYFECNRSRGDLVRYNPSTNELGVISKDGIIRTYFKPVRCASLPAALSGIKKCHNAPTNMQYVESLCTQY
jgi:pyocin large subunit-like protein